MKKHIVFASALASLFTLGACDYNEDNFPGFDQYDTILDVRNDTLDMASSDYSALAKLSANKEIALAKDPAGESVLNALTQVGKDQFFTDVITPLEYLPAYLKSKYPYASNQSKVKVNYRVAENLPRYLTPLNAANSYELSADDYKTIWGENKNVSFLSPSTVSKIPSLLKAGKKDEFRLVKYAYSDTEPSFGGGEGGEVDPAPSYTNIGDALAAGAGTYTVKGEVAGTYAKGMLIKDATGIILVYMNAVPAYSVGDVLEVSGDISSYKEQPLQFSNKAEIKFLERSKSFEYPTSRPLTADDIKNYPTIQKLEYVTYEGTLRVSQGSKGQTYYNVEVDGVDGVQGSIQYPALPLDDMKDQKVKVTGYTIGSSGSSSTKYMNTMATSVELADGSSKQFTPIGQVALSADGNYTSKGFIVAKSAKGFVLNDGTGSIYVYKQIESEVGTLVTISGTTSSKYGKQFDKSATVDVVQTTAKYTYPAPRSMAAADMDAYVNQPFMGYVSYQGLFKISKSSDGNKTYYNIEVDGATVQGSLDNPVNEAELQALNDKQVVVTGYAYKATSSKYVTTILTEIKEAASAASVRTAATRAAGVDPNMFALYQYNGSAWKLCTESDTEAKMKVIQPADYEKIGSNYISKADETLPVYLQQALPYAKKNDKYAVVYLYEKDKEEKVGADEYVFDGTAWVKTINSVPGTMTFMLSNNTWVEAKEYYNHSFNKVDVEPKAFIVNVELGGKDYVWSGGPSYTTIQASGYYQQARNTESWLITQPIELIDAVAPMLTFQANANYLSGNSITDNIAVYVTTDIFEKSEDADTNKKAVKDRVETGKWVKLEFAQWPDSSTFIDMSTDLSAYKDQKIVIGFCYKSTTDFAGTLKLRNVLVKE